MQRAACCAIAGIATGVVLSFAGVSPAHACGACFAPPSEVTTVDSHRMVISLSAEETVLWDQIVYSGSPEDFAWVLPVPTPDVRVELADPDFFTTLDVGTTPIVFPPNPPPRTCGADAGCGGGCGDDGGASPDAATDGVTVYDEGTVGPYETATVGSESRNALYDWLTAKGYAITPASLPVIEDYLDRGYVFVALRLRPGLGVQAMQPVRVHYPGYMGSFPLQGVVVGTKGIVNLSLWVIAEQRYQASNYAMARVRARDLVWDWRTRTSNYDDAFDEALLDAGGRAWVVEYAGLLSMLPWVGSPSSDFSVAGYDRSGRYVTRLRTRIRTIYVDEDLQLAPAADPSSVSNSLIAYNEINRPPDPTCNDGCSSAFRRHSSGLATMVLVLACTLIASRRRQR